MGKLVKQLSKHEAPGTYMYMCLYVTNFQKERLSCKIDSIKCFVQKEVNGIWEELLLILLSSYTKY